MVTRKTSGTAAKKPMSAALQKAREARANGTAAPRQRKPIPQWEAPVDFKPHFLEILVKTEKDGLLGPDIKVTRYKGRYDPEADPSKKVLVNEYDSRTVQGILSRLSMVTFVTNAAKRLPANKLFQIVLRVGKKKDGMVTISYKSITQITRLKGGRTKEDTLDKRDPTYRRFRKAARILPAAFSKTLMPPKVERRSRKTTEE